LIGTFFTPTIFRSNRRNVAISVRLPPNVHADPRSFRTWRRPWVVLAAGGDLPTVPS